MQGDPVLAKFGIIIGKLRDQLESLYESARGVRRMTTPGERMLGITHRPKFGA